MKFRQTCIHKAALIAGISVVLALGGTGIAYACQNINTTVVTFHLASGPGMFLLSFMKAIKSGVETANSVNNLKF